VKTDAEDTQYNALAMSNDFGEAKTWMCFFPRFISDAGSAYREEVKLQAGHLGRVDG
jgi:hypothetical protein